MRHPFHQHLAAEGGLTKAVEMLVAGEGDIYDRLAETYNKCLSLMGKRELPNECRQPIAEELAKFPKKVTGGTLRRKLKVHEAARTATVIFSQYCELKEFIGYIHAHDEMKEPRLRQELE